LTASEADLGIRSSLGSQVAQLEGLVTVSGSSDRFHLAIGSRVETGAVTKARRLRTLWAALPSFMRDVLGAYYTGSAKVDDPNGYRRFPAGAESKLGERMAGVAFLVANLAGTTKQLVAALVKGSKTALAPWADEAERLVREAHNAFYELRGDNDEDDTEDEASIADGAYSSEMTSWAQPAAKSCGGVWRQA
jgi:hypothetical protein